MGKYKSLPASQGESSRQTGDITAVNRADGRGEMLSLSTVNEGQKGRRYGTGCAHLLSTFEPFC